MRAFPRRLARTGSALRIRLKGWESRANTAGVCRLSPSDGVEGARRLARPETLKPGRMAFEWTDDLEKALGASLLAMELGKKLGARRRVTYTPRRSLAFQQADRRRRSEYAS